MTSQASFSRLLRYSAELVVVFLGVWLGLLAENYRESRLERAAERVSLDRLVRDLEFDEQDMSGNLRRATEGRIAAMWLLERGDSAGVNRDSVEHYLTGLQESSILVANTSEYTALKSAGQINIIRNADLRQRIAQLYESYPFVEQLHENENTELRNALDHIAPFVRVSPPGQPGAEASGDIVPVAVGAVRLVGDTGDVLGQPEFLLALSRLVLTRSILQTRYEDMIDEIGELRVLALGEL